MFKIAIVEDAEDNRELLYYVLVDEFKVIRYSTGEEALQNLTNGNIPDLIILDIWLTGIDGLEVLRQLRDNERLRHIPGLALTANAMTGDREKYLRAGFDEYVSKPIVNIDEFLTTVRRLLNGKS